MKEVFEKIIERLEEEKGDFYHNKGGDYSVYNRALGHAIEIVNQVAEEYGKDKYVSIGAYKQVAWERDIAIEQLHELGYEFGQKIDSNDGWIPCSEDMPKKDGKYIVCTTKGSVYCTKYHSRGRYFGTDMNTHIEAWQPLPQAYQPKGELNEYKN